MINEKERKEYEAKIKSNLVFFKKFALDTFKYDFLIQDNENPDKYILNKNEKIKNFLDSEEFRQMAMHPINDIEFLISEAMTPNGLVEMFDLKDKLPAFKDKNI